MEMYSYAAELTSSGVSFAFVYAYLMHRHMYIPTYVIMPVHMCVFMYILLPPHTVHAMPYNTSTQMSWVPSTYATLSSPSSIYTKNIRRSFSFQAGPLQRESVEDAPGHDYVMDTITEADGRNHMYDQPENVRRASETYRSSGGVILVGSSSENNSNTGGYSMLHPDDEEDQVASPTQQSQHYPPPIPHHGSFLSGVPASSFTQVTTVSSVKASEAPLYAEVEDTDRKKSVQGCTPHAAPVSPNSNQGDGQTPIADMWYHQSVEDVLQGYSLSQPAFYHAPNGPLEYENPLPTWSQMDAASKTISNQQVRRAASQKHNGRMMPQLPPGLRTALV